MRGRCKAGRSKADRNKAGRTKVKTGRSGKTAPAPAHRGLQQIFATILANAVGVSRADNGIVGVLQNTVKTRMFHARKRIAELMAERGIDRAWL